MEESLLLSSSSKQIVTGKSALGEETLKFENVAEISLAMLGLRSENFNPSEQTNSNDRGRGAAHYCVHTVFTRLMCSPD